MIPLPNSFYDKCEFEEYSECNFLIDGVLTWLSLTCWDAWGYKSKSFPWECATSSVFLEYCLEFYIIRSLQFRVLSSFHFSEVHLNITSFHILACKKSEDYFKFLNTWNCSYTEVFRVRNPPHVNVIQDQWMILLLFLIELKSWFNVMMKNLRPNNKSFLLTFVDVTNGRVPSDSHILEDDIALKWIYGKQWKRFYLRLTISTFRHEDSLPIEPSNINFSRVKFSISSQLRS